ncbi:N-acetylmuramoyl-L-alanine amidase [Robiginitalea aurantiaca]|uniref:N-acetylmuramoyl-L-alanine amidase n=1 Tax=Robiginitalea aurantiaca TaxID=3056915 RepID=A0ABT7WFQ6_9FLAO|nr:peptidoglycan recognition family protein [Robiginitalea aurantiaca]MDM9631754.1 peptidoglycan recognition family protein [Robiginitalea aurantiaca]
MKRKIYRLLRLHTLFALSVLLLGVMACGSTRPVIVERPISFGPDRQALTIAYLKSRYDLPARTPAITPRMVVLHWTAIPTLEGSLEAFQPERLPSARGDIQQAGALNVSAHYLVDQDGTIYQLLPDTVMARHTIGLNHCAIGIENVGGTPETPLTEAQLESNTLLVRFLAKKYPIEYLIGHYEYTAFEGHPLWLEKDSGYRTLKTDPGEAFMDQVRQNLSDLSFKPNPELP